MEHAPIKYSEAVTTLRKIYDSLEDDVAALRNSKLDLAKARVILQARRAQLRTVEVALAGQRLFLQFDSSGKKSQALSRRVSK